MNRDDRNASIREIFAKVVREYDGALRGLEESEREDRERFEQGLDSKYGWPEDEYENPAPRRYVEFEEDDEDA